MQKWTKRDSNMGLKLLRGVCRRSPKLHASAFLLLFLLSLLFLFFLPFQLFSFPFLLLFLLFLFLLQSPFSLLFLFFPLFRFLLYPPLIFLLLLLFFLLSLSSSSPCPPRKPSRVFFLWLNTWLELLLQVIWEREMIYRRRSFYGLWVGFEYRHQKPSTQEAIFLTSPSKGWKNVSSSQGIRTKQGTIVLLNVVIFLGLKSGVWVGPALLF